MNSEDISNHPWAMDGCNAEQSYRTNFLGPESPAILWKHETDSKTIALPLISANGDVFYSTNHYLSRLNATGNLLWRIRLQSEICCTGILLENGDSIMHEIDGSLECIFARGERHWIISAPDDIASPGLNTSRHHLICDSNSNIYLRHDNKWVYKYNSEGRILGKFESWDFCGVGIHSVSVDGSFYALQSDKITKYSASNTIDEICKIDSYGLFILCANHKSDYLHVYCGNGQAVAVEISTGRKRNYLLHHPITSAGILSDGNIVTNSVGITSCLDAEGRTLWSRRTFERLCSSVAIDVNDYIYFATPERMAYCLDKNGNIVWRMAIPDPVIGGIAISPDRNIIMNTMNGMILCIG